MKIFDNIRKFGFAYLFYTLKHKIIRNKPHDMCDFLYRQNYYQSLSPEKYPSEIKKWHYMATGKELCLDKPVTFTEKIEWLKLYDSSPLKSLCSDKMLVPKWVEEQCELDCTVRNGGG